MAQYIYLVLAILVLGILGATANRTIGGNQTRQALNETETLVTTVGNEMLDDIGRSWFDRYVFTQRNAAPKCGRPTTAEKNLLTDYANFGGVVNAPRPTIEDWHGLDTTFVRGGFEYDLAVRIRYVPDDAPKTSEADTLTTESFAKEAVVEITNPYFEVGDQPLTLTMTRTFTFGCPTNPTYVPLLLPGQSCPTNPCSRP